MKAAVFSIALIASTSPALAERFTPISDHATFISLVSGKQLRNRLYGVRLNVLENGQIQGRAIGWDISGTWSWNDGFFCREMQWGSKEIPYNCQLVEAKGNQQLRFTVDRGAGDSASFTVR